MPGRSGSSRRREHAVWRGAWFDGEHLAQDILLTVFGNDVIKDAEDIGLLAEDLLVGIVGKEAAIGTPAFGGRPVRTCATLDW